ncbi:uncharacterized protein STEHIDRAFT_145693 [Stereum hirsutum FP-91666 SS1]|uniref:uncharacterized protein n=1 Tax=Stereum hirsutum (strain FP-91666) TaxID=721885 RepID=UPI000440E713|nr:uncharacterized protein STEHIDRAFT_145693 [Stereum hirsutum FP-91666 SS1]EIM88869.1 hypothetical protein STEHIDRAFT_145693 [Stereum hirsutum FP-91666 SS1]
MLSFTRLASVASLVALASAQNNTGTLFNFIPGLGACGLTNTSDQSVASVSQTIFSTFPGATANPNDNPICTHNVTITSNGTTVTAQIVDFCPTCDEFRIGLSPGAFAAFAPPSDGIVANVTWSID